jgi:hypothetical protein
MSTWSPARRWTWWVLVTAMSACSADSGPRLGIAPPITEHIGWARV